MIFFLLGAKTVRAIKQTGFPLSNITLNATEELVSQMPTQGDIKGIEDAVDVPHPKSNNNNWVDTLKHNKQGCNVTCKRVSPLPLKRTIFTLHMNTQCLLYSAASLG